MFAPRVSDYCASEMSLPRSMVTLRHHLILATLAPRRLSIDIADVSIFKLCHTWLSGDGTLVVFLQRFMILRICRFFVTFCLLILWHRRRLGGFTPALSVDAANVPILCRIWSASWVFWCFATGAQCWQSECLHLVSHVA